MCVPCVWQWDVDELDSLVREIEAGEATLPARRLLAIALARKGDMSGAETQARAVLASEAADPSNHLLVTSEGKQLQAADACPLATNQQAQERLGGSPIMRAAARPPLEI